MNWYSYIQLDQKKWNRNNADQMKSLNFDLTIFCLDYYFPVLCFLLSLSRRSTFLWCQLQWKRKWNADFFVACAMLCTHINVWRALPFVSCKYSICMQDLCPKNEMMWNRNRLKISMVLCFLDAKSFWWKSISTFSKCKMHVLFFLSLKSVQRPHSGWVRMPD